MKALIIDEPWISLILSGDKTWEMRSSRTSIRGPIALIRKGTGRVVGTAKLIESLPQLAAIDYSQNERFHCIPSDRQDAAITGGWVYPWVLSEARPLPSVVPYAHPPGAVIWVNLDKMVIQAISVQATGALASGRATSDAPDTRSDRSATRSRSSIRGRAHPNIESVALTGGNIRNGHIYLRSVAHLFPADAIGGGNAATAGTPVRVTFEPGRMVETDIAGDKMIFRERAAVRDFFERAGASEDDQVSILPLGPREFLVTLDKRGS